MSKFVLETDRAVLFMRQGDVTEEGSLLSGAAIIKERVGYMIGKIYKQGLPKTTLSLKMYKRKEEVKPENFEELFHTVKPLYGETPLSEDPALLLQPDTGWAFLDDIIKETGQIEYKGYIKSKDILYSMLLHGRKTKGDKQYLTCWFYDIEEHVKA